MNWVLGQVVVIISAVVVVTSCIRDGRCHLQVYKLRNGLKGRNWFFSKVRIQQSDRKALTVNPALTSYTFFEGELIACRDN